MRVEMLKIRYESGRITRAMLRVYVQKGVISPEDFKDITGEDYA